MIFIYALIDPISNQIRYVGKTKHKLEYRLKAHLKDKTKSYKTNWIKSLKGELPIIIELDKIEEINWEFWEKYWILLVKSWGFRLTNLTEGGEGHAGFKQSEETKKKRADKLRGTKRSEETKKRLSDIKKGVVFSNSHKENISKSLKGRIIRKESRENIGRGHCKRILQLSLKDEIIKEWNSLQDASKYYNVHYSNISKCCTEIRKTCIGFKWKFKEK